MKLPMPCMSCVPPCDGRIEMDLYSLPIQDGNVYEFACQFGHKNVVLVPQLKFEILFEIGLNAIVDGYYREAVSSVASALERFQEFYLRVVAHKTGRAMEFEGAWRHLVKQSERQLGAFVLASVIHSGAEPNILASKWVEFRNLVIHRGKIPSLGEATNFASEVLRMMRLSLVELRSSAREEIGRVVGDHLKETFTRLQGKTLTATLNIPLILGGNPVEESSYLADVRTRLDEIERGRARAVVRPAERTGAAPSLGT